MNEELFDDRERWTPEALAAWLACLFDAVGRVDIRTRGVTLVIEGRDARVLRAISRITRCGDVDDRLDRRMAIWRISQPEQVRHFLNIVEPYLTTSLESAQHALQVLNRIAARRRTREARDREILALWLSGRSKNSIAEAFGLPFAEVSKVIARYKHGPSTVELSEKKNG